MPKKHNKVHYDKPSIPVHPSLASSSSFSPAFHGAHNGRPPAPAASVNDLIQHLRRSQASSSAERPSSENPHPSVHPSLKALLQVPDTPAPRPRARDLNAARMRRRGPAGPPPPKSWLIDSIHAPRSKSGVSYSDTGSSLSFSRRLDRLPGIFLPNRRSLMHQALMSLAREWYWHRDYDQFYLATLPERVKESLLAYIATYSPSPLTRSSADVLFQDESVLEDATGCVAVSHLDLSGAAVAKDISRFFEKQLVLTTSPHTDSAAERNDIPDSWDAPDTTLSSLTVMARFPNLTHLALAHPASPSWRALLAALPHLRQLTHLSLAYWPTPSLTPNAKTATTSSPRGNVQYGGTGFYSASDGDWSEAASILKRLARETLCLKWLDLEGCAEWAEALGSSDIGWVGPWRNVETLKASQGPIPVGIETVIEHAAITRAWTGMVERYFSHASKLASTSAEESAGEAWDVEEERRKYRLKVLWQEFLEREIRLLRLQGQIRKLRRAAGLKEPRFEASQFEHRTEICASFIRDHPLDGFG